MLASALSDNTSSAANINIPDPPSLVRARGNYDELHHLLGNLSSKMSQVSAQVDKEFLSSYRVHMMSIQAEIKTLKNDVAKGEQLLNSDAQVAKLENEAKWFSDECDRLSSHHNAMTRDCDQMRERLKAMHQQKVFLCDQLKAIMKRNKVLQAEIDVARRGLDGMSLISHSMTLPPQPKQAAGMSRIPKETASEEFNEGQMMEILQGYEREFDEKHANFMENGQNPFDDLNNNNDDDEDNNNIMDQEEEDFLAGFRPERKPDLLRFDSSPNLPPSRRKSMSPQQRRLKIQTEDTLFTKDPVAMSMPLLRAVSPSSPASAESPTLPRDLSHAKSMPQLQRTATSSSGFMLGKKEKKEFFAKKLQEIKEQRAPVEIELEYAIKDIFTEIQDRKRQAQSLSSTRKLPQVGGTLTKGKSSTFHNTAGSSMKSQSSEHRIVDPPIIYQTGGLTRLGLDQFTDNDKFAAVVKFLAKPHVFRQVVLKLAESQVMQED